MQDELLQALTKAVTLTTRTKSTIPHETSPWKAHRQFEELVVTTVSDRLLELFLLIRKQWLHVKTEFRKAAGEPLFRINGRIFINPKTGKPLTKEQWDEIVQTLDKALVQVFRDQPEVLARRALLLGKILQGMDYESRKETSLDTLPLTQPLPKDAAWQRAYTFGKQHAAEYIVYLSSKGRKQIATTILNAIHNRHTTRQLELALFDTFAALNRDWRMIAETEIAMNVNAGLLLAEFEDRREGETVFMIGVSAPDACPICKRLIDKKVVVLTEEPTPGGKVRVGKEVYDAVWPGKTNVGRKGDDLWPCVPLHPHCRCSWTRYYPEMKELLGLGKALLKSDIKKRIPEKLLDQIFTGEGSKYPDSAFDPEQLSLGIKIELEHTSDPSVAKRIAKDHLVEHPEYYKRLVAMEKELKKND